MHPHARRASSWSVYLIRARDGSLYTGIATDVSRRLAEHRAQDGRCARYLRGRAPLRLVFHRRIGTRGLALRVERRIKRLDRQRKEQIVRTRPGRERLIERLAVHPRRGR